MSSSRGVGCCLMLLLALLCDASDDPTVQKDVTDKVVHKDGLQRELPPNPDGLNVVIMQGLFVPELSHVIGSSDVTQEEVPNVHSETVPIDHPVFGPRFIAPVVDFPPHFPNTGNLQDICQFSKAPVRYPKDMFPLDGFGYETRQADAINQLQSWYGVCCGVNGTPEEKICCAEQAWKKSLAAYCFHEFSVKTSHYVCCKMSEIARWSCFDKRASNTSYNISSVVSYNVSSVVSNGNGPQKSQDFKYNSSACKGSSEASPGALPQQTEALNISFPPGRPDSSNIAQICAPHKTRPRYMPKHLPNTGYDWLIRQSNAINVLEREYNQCCEEEKGKQLCAEKKWKMMVDEFCKDEKKAEGHQFECCAKNKEEEQYSCFATSAPDPEYVH
ncbi:extracellular matrix protein 1-like [Carassius auratus]|uniref:Extracellular matrix protein 1-like n=1 Tax=Carassius auratus TaxID=7957 RepID=A0A6P6LL68_CARAU|nr:extracellular matrix protein 1-like [Carassius auratus]